MEKSLILIIICVILTYVFVYLPMLHKRQSSIIEKFAALDQDYGNSELIDGVVRKGLQSYLRHNCDCVSKNKEQFKEAFTYYWRNRLKLHETEYCSYLSKLSRHDRARYLYQWLSKLMYHAPPCETLLQQQH